MIGRNVAIYVAVTPIDMRKSFDGLAAAASEVLRKDPRAARCLSLQNKRGHRVKIVWWDRTGHCVLQNGLNGEHFVCIVHWMQMPRVWRSTWSSCRRFSRA